MPPDRARPSLVFRLGRLGRLARKELTEVLRDRRTIVTLVVMPLLLYPLLTIAFRLFARGAEVGAAPRSYRLGFASEEEMDAFQAYLVRGQNALGETPPELRALVEPQHLEEEVRRGTIDVALRRREGAPDVTRFRHPLAT